MNDLLIPVHAARTVEATSIDVSIAGLLGSLGAAGAALAVTTYFLGFLREQGQGQGNRTTKANIDCTEGFGNTKNRGFKYTTSQYFDPFMSKIALLIQYKSYFISIIIEEKPQN